MSFKGLVQCADAFSGLLVAKGLASCFDEGKSGRDFIIDLLEQKFCWYAGWVAIHISWRAIPLRSASRGLQNCISVQSGSPALFENPQNDGLEISISSPQGNAEDAEGGDLRPGCSRACLTSSAPGIFLCTRIFHTNTFAVWMRPESNPQSHMGRNNKDNY